MSACDNLLNPRMRICQTGTLTAVVTCLDAEYLWTPGGATTNNVPLRHSTLHEVSVECVECGDTDNDSYCFPNILGTCDDATLEFDCAHVGPETIASTTCLSEEYACAGDAIDYSDFEYNTDHLPVGAVTIAYGGVTTELDYDITVDNSKISAGTYYVPIRVNSVAGIPSNWALIRFILTDLSNGCCL